MQRTTFTTPQHRYIDDISRLRNRIDMGDRIFVRLKMGYRVIGEYILDRVADMTELIGELRHRTHGLRGLATLQIRNQSKGWSQERPLMLYAPVMPGVRNASPCRRSERQMYAPWECH